MQHYQPRIVIDFDAEDGEGQEAPQAGSGTVSGAVGATSGKPADLLRSIQNMRLTLKRLEQQKQQHAASVAAAPGAGATASIVVLDKQASLQAQMEQLRQAIEQRNSQLQRLPRPTANRSVTPPPTAISAVLPAPAVPAEAHAVLRRLARSTSMPNAAGLAASAGEQDQRQRQHRQHAQQQWPGTAQQRSPGHQPANQQPDEGGALQPGHVAGAAVDHPSAVLQQAAETHEAAAAASAFLQSLQQEQASSPPLLLHPRPASADPVLLRASGQDQHDQQQRSQQQQPRPADAARQAETAVADPAVAATAAAAAAAAGHQHEQLREDAPGPQVAAGRAGATASHGTSLYDAAPQSAADALAAARAAAAATAAKTAAVKAAKAGIGVPSSVLHTARPAPGAWSSGAAAARDPTSPLPQPTNPSKAGCLPGPSQVQQDTLVQIDPREHSDTEASIDVAVPASQPSPVGRPMLLLSEGLRRALLPDERRQGAAAKLASIQAQKQQLLVKCQVLQQLLQDAAESWEHLCQRERQLQEQLGLEGGPPAQQQQQMAATLLSDVTGPARERRRQQLAQFAAGATAQLGLPTPEAPNAAVAGATAAAAPAQAARLPAPVYERTPAAKADWTAASLPNSDRAASVAPTQQQLQQQQQALEKEQWALEKEQWALEKEQQALNTQQQSPQQQPQDTQQLPPQQQPRQPRTLQVPLMRGSKRFRSRSRSLSRTGSRGGSVQVRQRVGRSDSRSWRRRSPSHSSSSTSSSGRSGSRTSGSRSSNDSANSSSSASEHSPSRGRQRRSRSRGRPQHLQPSQQQRRRQAVVSRRSATPDAAPPTNTTGGGSSRRSDAVKGAVLVPAAPVLALLDKRREGRRDGQAPAREAAVKSGGSSRHIHVSDSLRRLFLQGLRRCCRLWHFPFSANRIEAQMERLQRGFVCRRELGASFAHLLLAMQREGHLQLDTSESSSSRWRVTAASGSATANDANPPAKPASNRRAAVSGAATEALAAELKAVQCGTQQAGSQAETGKALHEVDLAGDAKPAVATSTAKGTAVSNQQASKQQQGAAGAGSAAGAEPKPVAPVRFSLRPSSRLSGSKAAGVSALASTAAGAANSPAPNIAKPLLDAAAASNQPAGTSQTVVVAVVPGAAPWQKLAAIKAQAAAIDAAQAEAPAAALASAQAAAQAAASLAAHAEAPAPASLAAQVEAPAAAASQAAQAKAPAAAAAASQAGIAQPKDAAIQCQTAAEPVTLSVALPAAGLDAELPKSGMQVDAAAVAGHELTEAPSGARRPRLSSVMLPAAGASSDRTHLPPPPAARTLMAAVAAAAGSVKAAAVATNVAKTSAAFKYAAVQLQQQQQKVQQQQRRQTGTPQTQQQQQQAMALQPPQEQQTVTMQAQQQPQLLPAQQQQQQQPQLVRVLLLTSSNSSGEHIRLLLTPHLPPPATARPVRRATVAPVGRSRASQPGAAPTMQAGTAPSPQRSPWHSAQAAASHPGQQLHPWQATEQPAQHQPLARQFAQPQAQHPQDQHQWQRQQQHLRSADSTVAIARSTAGRELSSYADVALGASGQAGSSAGGGGGRHLSVFSTASAAADGAQRTGGRQPAVPQGPAAGLPPWLQGRVQQQQHAQRQLPPAQAALLEQLDACLRQVCSQAPCSVGIFGNSGLLASLLAKAVLQPSASSSKPLGGPPGSTPAPWRSQHRRATESIETALAAVPLPLQPLSTATAVPLLVDWPLCPYELRGSCRDAACRYQMAVDQPTQGHHQQQAQLLSPEQQQVQALLEQQQAAFAAKANARLQVLPSLEPAAPAPRAVTALASLQPAQKRQRVADAVVQAVALEQSLPRYAVSRHWASALGSSSPRGPRRSDPAQPFTSLLLAPAALLTPPAAEALAAASGLDPELQRQLLPGGAAPSDLTSQHQAAAQRATPSAASAQAQAAAAEERGRYFGGAATPVSQGHATAVQYWQRQYEQLLLQKPEDEELWLSYAVRHAVEASHGSGDGSGAILSPDVCEQMLLILKRGLEHNRQSPVLWPLYLHLYCKQPGCSAGMMADSALQFAPHSYRLWLVAVQQQQQWQEAAALLQRGILALCKRPAPAAAASSASLVGSNGSSSLPEEQAAAALDLGLRLLQLLCAAEQPESHAQMVQWAGADLGSSSDQSLLQRSKAVLLGELHQGHPRLLCVLCCSCAFAAVRGHLPLAVEHSLGLQQPPLLEVLRGWPALQPLSLHQLAAGGAVAACRAALITGADCLGLFGPEGKSSLHLGRSLLQQQRSRLCTAQKHLMQQQPEAVLDAQSCLLLAMLRLDSMTGMAAASADGGSLLAEVVGSNSGTPGNVTASGTPYAALVAVEQRWHAAGSLARGEQHGEEQQQQQPACMQLLQQHSQRQLSLERPALQQPAGLVLLLQEAVMAVAAAEAAYDRQRQGCNALLLACLRGRMHPAAAAALAAAVASSRRPQAADAALQLLGSWAVAYSAMDPALAWPHQPLAAALDGSSTPAPAALAAAEELGLAATAAFQHLVGKRSSAEQGQGQDSAATVYACCGAAMHALLLEAKVQHKHIQQQAASLALAALHVPAMPGAESSVGAVQLGQQEAACLSLLAALAGSPANQAAAVQQVLAEHRVYQMGQQPALVWPRPQAVDPLAAAVLAPPSAAAASQQLPAELMQQVPLRLQVQLVEALLGSCTPAVAAAAVTVAQQAAEEARAAAMCERNEQQQRASLWRFPALSWAVPAAATALVSSIPPAAPQLWHQAVSAAAMVSPRAAAELAAAATAVHPYSLRLRQQHQQLLANQQQSAATLAQQLQQGVIHPPWHQAPLLQQQPLQRPSNVNRSWAGHG